jgi:hypothetical protein
MIVSPTAAKNSAFSYLIRVRWLALFCAAASLFVWGGQILLLAPGVACPCAN